MAKQVITELRVNFLLDISQLLHINRYSLQNRPRLLRVAAERYLRFLKQRAISLSSGRGEWPKLKKSTIQRKKRRGVATNPSWILREHDKLLFAMGVRTRSKDILVGYVRNTTHPRGITVNRLVRIHSRGSHILPVRQIIVLPNAQVKQQMVEDIRKEYNREIRASRRKK